MHWFIWFPFSALQWCAPSGLLGTLVWNAVTLWHVTPRSVSFLCSSHFCWEMCAFLMRSFSDLSTLNCETPLFKLRLGGPNGAWIWVTELEIFISVRCHSHTVPNLTETQASPIKSYRSGDVRRVLVVGAILFSLVLCLLTGWFCLRPRSLSYTTLDWQTDR